MRTINLKTMPIDQPINIKINEMNTSLNSHTTMPNSRVRAMAPLL